MTVDAPEILTANIMLSNMMMNNKKRQGQNAKCQGVSAYKARDRKSRKGFSMEPSDAEVDRDC
jgi:hypothetical protein